MASWASSVAPAMCGREDDVVEVEEGGVLEGLLVEDVEGGAGDVAGLDGFGEGVLRR